LYGISAGHKESKAFYHVYGYYGSYGGIRHKVAIWASDEELSGRGGLAVF